MNSVFAPARRRQPDRRTPRPAQQTFPLIAARKSPMKSSARRGKMSAGANRRRATLRRCRRGPPAPVMKEFIAVRSDAEAAIYRRTWPPRPPKVTAVWARISLLRAVTRVSTKGLTPPGSCRFRLRARVSRLIRSVRASRVNNLDGGILQELQVPRTPPPAIPLRVLQRQSRAFPGAGHESGQWDLGPGD